MRALPTGQIVEMDDVAETAAGLGIADDKHAADLTLAMGVSTELNKHYPGWMWAVNASHANGLVTVRNLNLSSKFGFVVKIGDLNGPVDVKREAVAAGGEMLERFKMPRGPMRPEYLTGHHEIFTAPQT